MARRLLCPPKRFGGIGLGNLPKSSVRQAVLIPASSAEIKRRQALWTVVTDEMYIWRWIQTILLFRVSVSILFWNKRWALLHRDEQVHNWCLCHCICYGGFFVLFSGHRRRLIMKKTSWKKTSFAEKIVEIIRTSFNQWDAGTAAGLSRQRYRTKSAIPKPRGTQICCTAHLMRNGWRRSSPIWMIRQNTLMKSAPPIAPPGWPDLAFSTMDAAKIRMLSLRGSLLVYYSYSLNFKLNPYLNSFKACLLYFIRTKIMVFFRIFIFWTERLLLQWAVRPYSFQYICWSLPRPLLWVKPLRLHHRQRHVHPRISPVDCFFSLFTR